MATEVEIDVVGRADGEALPGLPYHAVLSLDTVTALRPKQITADAAADGLAATGDGRVLVLRPTQAVTVKVETGGGGIVIQPGGLLLIVKGELPVSDGALVSSAADCQVHATVGGVTG